MATKKKEVNWIIFTISLFIGNYTEESIDFPYINDRVEAVLIRFLITLFFYYVFLLIWDYIKGDKEKV